MAAECGADVHQRTARCLLGLFDVAAGGLADRLEFDAEADSWGIEVRGLSREDLSPLIESSIRQIPATEHRRLHREASDFVRWGRRGGLRTLALWGRRRVQSAPAFSDASAATQREVVAAFLAASREGDFAGLLGPHVVLRADPTVVDYGAAAEVRSPDGMAQTFAGRAQAARLTLVESVGGWPRVVFGFTVRGGRVIGIELLRDPETLDVLDLEPVQE
jgi:hypothetical protein